MSKRPRIAVAADTEVQRKLLRKLLEQNGQHVVITASLGNRLLNWLEQGVADVLLIDLDDHKDQDLELLDLFLDTIDMPILFNDGSMLQDQLTHAEAGEKLAAKLNLLYRAETAGDDALGESAQDDTLQQENAQSVESSAMDAIETLPQAESAALKLADNLKLATSVWVLGASLGGPKAIQSFLGSINVYVPAAFIIVLHIKARFIDIFAKQLARSSGLNVSLIKDGGLLQENQIVLMPGDRALSFDADGRICLQKTEVTTPIDQTLMAVGERYSSDTNAIIFSGMGHDGVNGCTIVGKLGGKVWIQEPASCVIATMPEQVQMNSDVALSASPENLAVAFMENYRQQYSKQA